MDEAQRAGVRSMPTDALAEMLQQSFKMFIGTPEELVPRIGEFAGAGADEVMLQWIGLDDTEGLEVFGEHGTARATNTASQRPKITTGTRQATRAPGGDRRKPAADRASGITCGANGRRLPLLRVPRERLGLAVVAGRGR
jgi:hypothetical protein